MQTRDVVSVERAGPAAIVTMCRPERRNALSLEMMTELDRALERVGSDASVRAIILAAKGPAFSAGHDLRELLDRDEDEYRQIFNGCVELMERIHAVPQPVIAEVAGIATAAGCQLVAASDLAVASDQATFATPGVRIGLFCSTPMVPLVRAIGRKRAMEMLLTGAPVSAQTALSWGLVNRVVLLDQLRDTTLALAETIASASGEIVGIGKAAFYAQADVDESAAYQRMRDVMISNAALPDAQEGISAFLGKRAPVWESVNDRKRM